MVCVHTALVITYAINMKNYLSCASFNESFTNISEYFLETAMCDFQNSVVWSHSNVGNLKYVSKWNQFCLQQNL
jgi:hypothetical protein